MSKRNKTILLTGGGTAGHVSPHFALIPLLTQEGYAIHYIGSKTGIEKELLRAYPEIPYLEISSGKLRRYFSFKNFTDLFRIAAGVFQATWKIFRMQPDLCFSKGGFVSVPVVIGAWLNRVPVLLHESDMTVGLANRLSLPFAKKIATTFPECAEKIGEKAVFTGTPLRPDLFEGNKEKGLAYAAFPTEKPVLLVTGGSSGAQRINEVLRASLSQLLPSYNVFHLCGKGNLDSSFENTDGYIQKEFLTQALPHVFAMADLVVSRAGSNAISELQALNKPMLLIPYPKAQTSRGDQVINAESFSKRGLAHVLWQENLTESTFVTAVHRLYESRNTLLDHLQKDPAKNGTVTVMQLIHQLQKH
ncbi:MAG: undecaprenyldiphospho-muramoylpentapeptide beta-N-acetylglucosaminyltransferase [Clostridiales bacterium]|nr:undecaprenyldiphospho-muramoylpentapeptide beta-N-acetylglucosaminyltransferase [Clostridiales bacterium]